MPYLILVFSQKPLVNIDGSGLMNAIKGANFSTLCDQYGLDPALISSTLADLEVLIGADGYYPYFTLSYSGKDRRPLVIYGWETEGKEGTRLLQKALFTSPDVVKALLRETHAILAIELSRSQLDDLGLLLAYEVARWALKEGEGLMRGLDEVWYHLNQHAAFVPIDD